MTDTAAVSDEPIIVASQEVKGGADSLTMSVRQGYTPPLDGTDDDFQAFDNWIARQVAELLVKHYYGYEWHVMAESRQGIVAFSIPELMGPTLKQVIRLAQYKDLTPALIKRTAGEMLERMGLRRGPIDIPAYLAAIGRRHTFEFGDVKR